MSSSQYQRFRAALLVSGILPGKGNNRAVQNLGSGRKLYQKGWDWAKPIENNVEGATTLHLSLQSLLLAAAALAILI